MYLRDTQRTFGNYTEIAELADGRSRATAGTPDNARSGRRNRWSGRIDPRTCVQSLTTLSHTRLGIPVTIENGNNGTTEQKRREHTLFLVREEHPAVTSIVR